MKQITTAIFLLIINSSYGQQPPRLGLQKDYDSLFKKYKEYNNISSITPGYRYKTIHDDVEFGRMPLVGANTQQPVYGRMPIQIPAPLVTLGAIPDMMPKTLIQVDSTKNFIHIPGKPQFFNSLPKLPR